MSVDFSILKYPIAEPLGTLDDVSARVEWALGIAIGDSGVIAGRSWEIEYRAVIADGSVIMLRCTPRSPCTRRRPQFLGDWLDALRMIACVLDAGVVVEQLGVPLGAADDDVPARVT